MVDNIPLTMKAVVGEGKRAVVKEDITVPELEDGFMLIKVIAVAGNTSEYKHLDWNLSPDGAILGCDAVGRIVKIGPNVDQNEFAIGDVVYSFVHGASTLRPKNGAFGEYVAVDSGTTYKAPNGMRHSEKDVIPVGPVETFEAAAAIPFSLTTAGMVVLGMGLKLEWEPATPQNDFPILIWGGATGVGQSIIQLVKRLHGYTKIIVVASKKHNELLLKYGADEVFDYHDPNVVQQIKKKYPNIQHLIDSVSTQETIQQVYKCSSDTHPVTLMQLVFLTIDDIKPEDRKENVTIIGTMIYSLTGLEVIMGEYHFPANPQYRRDAVSFIRFISPKVASGEILHMPVKVYKNGLLDIPEITDIIRKGKTAGNKLVTVLQ